VCLSPPLLLLLLLRGSSAGQVYSTEDRPESCSLSWWAGSSTTGLLVSQHLAGDRPPLPRMQAGKATKLSCRLGCICKLTPAPTAHAASGLTKCSTSCKADKR
jgi:hypothetical protein